LRLFSEKVCEIMFKLLKSQTLWIVEKQKCRSRKMLKNGYLVAKIGFDTAENGPPKGFKIHIFNDLHW